MFTVARSAAFYSAHLPQPRHPNSKSRRQKLKNPRLARTFPVNRDSCPRFKNQSHPVLETSQGICQLKRDNPK